MGIIKRLITVIKSNINDLISKAEDPEKMLEQLIIDMSEDLVKAKQEVAVAIADEKRLERQMLKYKKVTDEWYKKAELAVANGDDKLAMEALKRQEESEQMYKDFEEQWRSQKEATDKLRYALRKLNDKIQEARRKKNLLIARQKRAEAQKRINKTLESLSNVNAFDTFARMEKKIEDMEAKADAEAELNKELSGESTDEKFKQLEMDSNIQSKLAELKAKMGK